jgi:hypothetical protein
LVFFSSGAVIYPSPFPRVRGVPDLGINDDIDSPTP